MISSPPHRWLSALRWSAAILFVAIAGRTMMVQFSRLIWDRGPIGAIDLGIFHTLVDGWFRDLPVYVADGNFTYPPASYVLLWPLVGWLTVDAARWWWAAGYVAALAGLIHLILREIRATTAWERAFAIVIVLAMNAVGVCIGNGQLIVFLLPPLLLSVFLVARGPVSWQRDVLSAAMFVAVLVKPTVTAPFFWLLLFLPRRLRPALMTVAGYVALTLVAASVRDADALTLFRQWLSRGAVEAGAAGYGNIQLGLTAIGLGAWMMPASLAVLVAAGAWIYRHRHEDIWLLLGVTAVVARVWSYHRVYDDMLLLLTAIALFQVARRAGSSASERFAAGALFVVLVATLVAPGPWHDIEPPWRDAYDALHVVVWLAALGYLVRTASHSRVFGIGGEGVRGLTLAKEL